MAAEYMKKTRDTLGKIIKKPPLTDKLLGKPPFRFLHDIFTEVIRTSGFMNGLFSSTEMDSKNVSAKEDKVAFLQKVIDVVSIISGEQLSVRPSKIVAGHEPDKTNELLQAIAKCIQKNVSSDDAVQQVNSGKKPSSKVQEKPPAGPSKRKEGKENREKSDDHRKKRRERDDDKHERERSSDRRRRSASKEGRDKSRDKEGSREQGAGEGSEEKERERSREKSREKERNKEDRSKDRKERKESRSKVKESGSSSKKALERRTSSQTLQKSPEKKSSSTNKQKKSQPNGPNTERRRKKSLPKREEEPPDHEERDSKRRDRDRDAEEDDEGASQENQQEREERSEKPASHRPPRPASAKGHRRRPAPDRGSRGPANDDETSNAREMGHSRPARPPSARPAAPRVRQRPDAAEEEIARMESAGRNRTAPIIVDRGSRPSGGGMSSSDDEDDQFLVQEEDVQPPEMGKLSPVLNGGMNGEAAEEEGEHGGLVRKILETKKELETSAAKGANVTGKKRTEIERSPVNEVQRRKEREIVMRDIEKLRASVQKLCRSAVPLGKIIDYIQEDMDSMQNELLQWKRENKEHAAKLKEEESITIKTIEPLHAELEELDRVIAAQMDMIAASKCNVIKNQEKIDKMVAGVTARS